MAQGTRELQLQSGERGRRKRRGCIRVRYVRDIRPPNNAPVKAKREESNGSADAAAVFGDKTTRATQLRRNGAQRCARTSVDMQLWVQAPAVLLQQLQLCCPRREGGARAACAWRSGHNMQADAVHRVAAEPWHLHHILQQRPKIPIAASAFLPVAAAVTCRMQRRDGIA